MSSTPSPPEGGPLREHPDGVTIDLLVQPRASRTALGEVHDGALRLRIAAPPVDGAANAAIIEFLAKQLGVRRDALSLQRGATGRRKRVLVSGLPREDVAQRLGLE